MLYLFAMSYILFYNGLFGYVLCTTCLCITYIICYIVIFSFMQTMFFNLSSNYRYFIVYFKFTYFIYIFHFKFSFCN